MRHKSIIRIVLQLGTFALVGLLVISVLQVLASDADLAPGGSFDVLSYRIMLGTTYTSIGIVFVESLATSRQISAALAAAFFATSCVYLAVRALASSDKELETCYTASILAGFVSVGLIIIATIAMTIVSFLSRSRTLRAKRLAARLKGTSRQGRLASFLQAVWDWCSEWLPAVVVLGIATALFAHIRRPSLHVEGQDLSGKIALVTSMGSADSVAFSLASTLAKWGASVVVTAPARDEAVAMADALKDASGTSTVRGEELDLARLASVQSFAARWDARPLHILLDAASGHGAAAPGARTRDGVDHTIQVGFLSRVVLSSALSAALAAAGAGEARLVHVLPAAPASKMPVEVEHLLAVGAPRTSSGPGVGISADPPARLDALRAQAAVLTLMHMAGAARAAPAGARLFAAERPPRVRQQLTLAAERGAWRDMLDAIGDMVWGALSPDQAAAAALHAAVSPHLSNSTALFFSSEAAPFQHCFSCAGPAGSTFRRCGESRLLRPLCGTKEFPEIAKDARRFAALKAATARAITEAEKEEERVSRQEREQEAIEQAALKIREEQEALQRHEARVREEREEGDASVRGRAEQWQENLEDRAEGSLTSEDSGPNQHVLSDTQDAVENQMTSPSLADTKKDEIAHKLAQLDKVEQMWGGIAEREKQKRKEERKLRKQEAKKAREEADRRQAEWEYVNTLVEKDRAKQRKLEKVKEILAEEEARERDLTYGAEVAPGGHKSQTASDPGLQRPKKEMDETEALAALEGTRAEDLELVQRERAAEKAEGCADKDRAQRTAQEELDRWHEAEVRAGRGSQAELEVRRRERETAAERDARARGGQALGP